MADFRLPGNFLSSSIIFPTFLVNKHILCKKRIHVLIRWFYFNWMHRIINLLYIATRRNNNFKKKKKKKRFQSSSEKVSNIYRSIQTRLDYITGLDIIIGLRVSNAFNTEYWLFMIHFTVLSNRQPNKIIA